MLPLLPDSFMVFEVSPSLHVQSKPDYTVHFFQIFLDSCLRVKHHDFMATLLQE